MTNDLNRIYPNRNKRQRRVRTAFSPSPVSRVQLWGLLDGVGAFPLLILFLMGCSAVKFTGDVILTSGKLAGAAVKTTGQVAQATGKVATATGNVLSEVIRFPHSLHVIKLIRQGDSFYAKVTLNKKVVARMLIDTGASDTQINHVIGNKLGLSLRKGKRISVRIAGGYLVQGTEIVLDEVRVGGVAAKNVSAIILDKDFTQGYDGLLGMSFFKNFIVQIDAEKEELLLKKKS